MTDRIGKKFILYYDDGEKVTRREVVIKEEDADFITTSERELFLKNRIVRMQGL